jgi:hypothetical protein
MRRGDAARLCGTDGARSCVAAAAVLRPLTADDALGVGVLNSSAS